MRFIGWRLDALGHLRDQRVNDLQPGVNVLLGPNEFGKSTLRYFLTWTLFGYPPGQSSDVKRYKPIDGSTAGGMLHLQLDSGELIEWTRKQGPKEQLEITGSNGAPTATTEAQVHGGLSLDFYRAVFSVGAQDLQKQELLDSSRAIERVRTAGLTGGGRSPVDALTDIAARKKTLLSPRSGLIKTTRVELDAAANDRSQAQMQSEKLHKSEQLVEEKSEEVAERRVAAESFRKQKIRLERYCQLKPVALDVEEARARLEQAVAIDLGTAPLTELETQLERAEANQNRFEKAKIEHREVKELADALVVDSQLLEHGPAIEALAAEASAMTERSGLHATLQSELERSEHELEVAKRELGPVWGDDVVVASDVALDPPVAANQAMAALTGAQKVAEQSDRGVGQAEAQASRDRAEVQERESISSREYGYELTQSELIDKTATLQRATTLGADLDIARRDVRDAERDIQLVTGSGAKARLWVWLVALAVILVVASVFAVFSDAVVVGAVVLVAALAALVLAFLQHPGRPGATHQAPAVAGSNQRLGTGQTQIQSIETDLRGIAAEFELDAKALLAGAPAAIQKIKLASDYNDKLAAAVHRLKESQTEADRASGVAKGAHESLSRAEASWFAWVERNGLPSNDVEQVRGLLPGLRAAREKLATRDTAADKTRVAAERIADDQIRVTSLMDTLGYGPREQSLASLAASVKDANASQTEREQQYERVARLNTALEADRMAMEEDTRSMAVLLERAGVASADGFRDVAAQQDQRVADTKLVASFRRDIDVAFGVDGADQAYLDIGSGNEGEWKATLASEAQELVQAETDIGLINQELGRLQDELKRAQDSADVAQADLQVGRLRASLGDLVDEWLVLSLAEQAIQQTVELFERERQPAVLRHAQESFARITSGRYSHIRVDGASDTLIVRNDNGTNVDATRLSTGTTEQLYLAMRFGLITETVQTNRLPVILDDPLVNTDPERSDRLADELVELGRQTQVLIFSCHPRTAQLFGDRANVVNLETSP